MCLEHCKEHPIAHVVYRIVEHDGGWAYRLGDTYSETFASHDDARAAWKAAVRDSHPDRLIARGVPPEAVNLAQQRLIAVNAAWEEIAAREAA